MKSREVAVGFQVSRFERFIDIVNRERRANNNFNQIRTIRGQRSQKVRLIWPPSSMKKAVRLLVEQVHDAGQARRARIDFVTTTKLFCSGWLLLNCSGLNLL